MGSIIKDSNEASDAKVYYQHNNRKFTLSFDRITTELLQIQDEKSKKLIRFDDHLLPPKISKVINQTQHKLLPLALQNTGPASISDLIQTGMQVTPSTVLCAIQYGNSSAVNRLLLSLANDKSRYDCVNHHFNCNNMLITAANFGNLEICKTLILYGADVEACLDSTGTKGNALFHAATSGHFSICDLLIKHGANVNAIIREDITEERLVYSTLLESLLKEYQPSKVIIALLRKNGAQSSAEGLHRC